MWFRITTLATSEARVLGEDALGLGQDPLNQLSRYQSMPNIGIYRAVLQQWWARAGLFHIQITS